MIELEIAERLVTRWREQADKLAPENGRGAKNDTEWGVGYGLRKAAGELQGLVDVIKEATP